jgi:hypothetical protein
MPLCKKPETQMSLAFLLERWGSVRELPVVASTPLLTSPG